MKKKELQCPKKIVSQVNILTLLILMLFQEMTDYGGRIHLVKAAFPFNGQDEDEVQFTAGDYKHAIVLFSTP